LSVGTRIVCTSIIIIAYNWFSFTNTFNTGISSAKIIIVTVNRRVDTGARIRVTYIYCAEIFIITNNWTIWASCRFVAFGSITTFSSTDHVSIIASSISTTIISGASITIVAINRDMTDYSSSVVTRVNGTSIFIIDVYFSMVANTLFTAIIGTRIAVITIHRYSRTTGGFITAVNSTIITFIAVYRSVNTTSSFIAGVGGASTVIIANYIGVFTSRGRITRVISTFIIIVTIYIPSIYASSSWWATISSTSI
jgi:hypothetical protein